MSDITAGSYPEGLEKQNRNPKADKAARGKGEDERRRAMAKEEKGPISPAGIIKEAAR